MPPNSSDPQAIGSPSGAFRQAIDALKSAGARTVLDCPAGEGLFAKMLAEAGFEPTLGDIYPDQFRLAGIECHLCDLNGTLPFDDASFDAVTCLNGLERVWARGQAMREFARVVKPGGTIVISYPNQGDLRRRMLNLVTGSVTWNVVGPPHVCDPTIEPPASNFRYAMTTANVLSGLESVGFELTSLRATHVTKGALLMAPLAIIPKLAAWFASDRLQTRYYLRASATKDALFGAFLVAVARRDPNVPLPEIGADRVDTNR